MKEWDLSRKKTIDEKKVELNEIIEKLGKVKNLLTGKLKDHQAIQTEVSQNRNKIRTVSTVQSEIERLKVIFEEAKKCLSTITPNQLDEIVKYNNPPKRVKLVLEAVMYLLLGKKLEWDQIRSEMIGQDFIQKVLKFDPSFLKPNIIETVKHDYIQHPDWNIEKIRNASQATGPLAEWLEMQLGLLKAIKQMSFAKNEMIELKSRKQALESREADLQTEIQYLEEEIGDLERRKTHLTQQIENPDIELSEEIGNEEGWTNTFRDTNMESRDISNTGFSNLGGEHPYDPFKKDSLGLQQDDETNVRPSAEGLSREELYQQFKKHSTVLRQVKKQTNFSQKNKELKEKNVSTTSRDNVNKDTGQLSKHYDAFADNYYEDDDVVFKPKKKKTVVNQAQNPSLFDDSNADDQNLRNGSTFQTKKQIPSFGNPADMEDDGNYKDSRFLSKNSKDYSQSVSGKQRPSGIEDTNQGIRNGTLNSRNQNSYGNNSKFDNYVDDNGQDGDDRFGNRVSRGENDKDTRASTKRNPSINNRDKNSSLNSQDRKKSNLDNRKNTQGNRNSKAEPTDKKSVENKSTSARGDKGVIKMSDEGYKKIFEGGKFVTGYVGLNPNLNGREFITKVTYVKNNQPLRVTKSAEITPRGSITRNVEGALPTDLEVNPSQANLSQKQEEYKESLRTVFQKSFQQTFVKNNIALLPNQNTFMQGAPRNYPNIVPIRPMISQIQSVGNQGQPLNGVQSPGMPLVIRGPISLQPGGQMIQNSFRSMIGVRRELSEDRLITTDQYGTPVRVIRYSPMTSPRVINNPVFFPSDKNTSLHPN